MLMALHLNEAGGGLLAQIFQHEMDHLEGILFIDHAENIHDYKRKPATEDAGESEDNEEVEEAEQESLSI